MKDLLVYMWRVLVSLFFVLKKPSDQTARFNALTLIGKKLVPQYRFKWPQMEWWDNETFNRYLKLFDETEGMNSDRRWMIYQLLRLINNVPGDTAECGVYKGLGSYIICEANANSKRYNRTHYLFDSFAGLSKPIEDDGSFWSEGDLSCGVEQVKKNLGEFNNVEYLKGWIPERFKDVAEKSFAFVHIDVDIYQPTFDSIEFFYPLMSPGGIIICDDYGFTSCPGATKAINSFLADKPEKMISLSGGGGFLIKGCITE